MKKKIKLIFCVIFFMICCLPMAALPFVRNHQNIEKKKEAEFPKLIVRGKINMDFSNDAQNYLNQRLPFRSYMLTAANFLKTNILRADSANVIQGKDDWLFYGGTVKDYMNTDAMTDRELNCIAITLSLLQENVKTKGGNFLFVPIPNKNCVYDEYMPDRYIRAHEDNLSRMNVYLEEYNINYVNMLDIMIANKDQILYHKRDTHWNYLGALIGYNAIMDGLSREHKTYDGVDYVRKKNWHGDLDKMLFPKGNFLDYEYSFDIKFDDFRFTIPAGVSNTKAQLKNYMSDKEDNDNRFRTARIVPQNGLKLYMVRDSFGRALLPFMIDNYDQAMFVRTKSPEMTMVGPKTDMVYEIVERNLRDIIHTAPFMTAPARDIVCGEVVDAGSSIHFDDEAYGYRIYGTVDDGILDDNSRIYVKLDSGDNKYYFEAFPIYEEKLLEKSDDNGYSLILDKNTISKGKYEISVIVGDKICQNVKTINIQ